MKAYSIDFRSQIVEAYKNQEGSMLKIACRFHVSRSFVQKIIRQEKETGSLKPLPRGGSISKLASYENTLQKIFQEKRNATLEELRILVREKTGVEVSASSICRHRQKIIDRG